MIKIIQVELTQDDLCEAISDLMYKKYQIKEKWEVYECDENLHFVVFRRKEE